MLGTKPLKSKLPSLYNPIHSEIGEHTMPVVTVEWLEGRDKDQKDKVARAITDAIHVIGGAKPEGTYVVFKDVPKENWATGGTLMSDK